MHDEIKHALTGALAQLLPVLRGQLGKFTEPNLVWHKESAGRWEGRYCDRPDIQKIFAAARGEPNEATVRFADLFLARHPEYSGMIGLAGLGEQRFNCARVPEDIARWLWYKHGTFAPDGAATNAAVEEFSQFIEHPTVKLQFQTQLLNFGMDADRLDLPDNSVIRRLSEDEVSALDGGPLTTLGFIRPQFGGPHEFAVEGEIEVAKSVGSSVYSTPSAQDMARRRLAKAILCLRTFKGGHIGFDYVHFRPIKFCPFATGSYGLGDLYVPFGSYYIRKDEEPPLREYAAILYQAAEPAMEAACNRLADAETRRRPQDRLVDAVIGMEALLLAALAGDLKGELSFRFSLHYSTTFDTPEERHQGFRVAKDLYNLRSKIAHGSTLKDANRVGGEQLTIATAAERATEALRRLIIRFLSNANAAPYKRPEFRERAYFGLKDGASDGSK